MIGKQERWQEDLFVAGPLSSLVPDDHILKRVDAILDLSWLAGMVKEVYCTDNGRPGIDPEAALRLMLARKYKGSDTDNEENQGLKRWSQGLRRQQHGIITTTSESCCKPEKI